MKKISLMALITMATFAKGAHYEKQALPLIVITDFDEDKVRQALLAQRDVLWGDLYSAIVSNDISSVKHSFARLEQFYGSRYYLWQNSPTVEGGLSLLAHALFLGADPEIISFLVKYGAPSDFKRKSDNSTLLDILLRESISSMRGKHAGKSEQEIAEIIGKYITNISEILADNKGRPLCIELIARGNKEALSVLGIYAPNLINKLDFGNMTPLQFAISQDSDNSFLEIVDSLLANGASQSINNEDEDGSTALLEAVCKNKLDVVKLLLANGAGNSINSREKSQGTTPLYAAVQNNNLEMVELLLAHEGKVDSADAQYGNTVLHRAVSNIRNENTTPIIKLLLAHGANPLKKNSRGKTALDLCTDLKDRQLLLESQARK